MLGDANTIRQETIEVAVRIRPLHPREILSQQESIWTTERQTNLITNINSDNTSAVMIPHTKQAELIYLRKIPPGQKTQYAFNRCFDASVSNQIVYEQVVKRIAVSSLQGINGTIFMYGQTGSGKTFTMMGGSAGTISATNQTDGKSPAQSSQISSSTTLQQQQQQAFQLGSFINDSRAQQQQQNQGTSKGFHFQQQQDPLRTEKSPRNVRGNNTTNNSVSPIRQNIRTDSTISNNNHKHVSSSHPGILELSLEDIFKQMAETPGRQYLLRCSYVEIYMDFVYDLLQTRDRLGETLQIGEDQNREFFVKGAVEETVGSIEEILELLRYGESNRHYASTTMNHISSRSHTVFRLCLRSMPANFSKSNSQDITESILNFVDLAGSEKISIHSSPSHVSSSSNSSTSKDRQIESKTINKSLFFLTQVINLKSSGKPEQFIPYRNSPLTKILRSSLGGNSRTGIILCLNPCLDQLEQSMSTLRFGNQASYIQNTIKQNYIRDENALSKLVDEYQTRIRILEAETTHTRDDSEILIKAIQELIQQKNELERQLQGVERGKLRREGLKELTKGDHEGEEDNQDDCIHIKNVGIINVSKQARRVQYESECQNQPLKESNASLKATLLLLGDSTSDKLSRLSSSELKELEILTMMLISNIRKTQKIKENSRFSQGLNKEEVDQKQIISQRTTHRQTNKKEKGLDDLKKQNYDTTEIEKQLSLFKKVESPPRGCHSPRIIQISQKPSSERNILEGSSMLTAMVNSSNSQRYPELQQQLLQQPFRQYDNNSNDPSCCILPATSSNTPLLQSFIVDKTVQQSGISSYSATAVLGVGIGEYKKLEEFTEINHVTKDIKNNNNNITNGMQPSQTMSLLSGVSNNSMVNSSSGILPNRNGSIAYFQGIEGATITTGQTIQSNSKIQQQQPLPMKPSFFETKSITTQISQFFNSNSKTNNNNNSNDLTPSITSTTTTTVNPITSVQTAPGSLSIIKPQIRSCSQGGNRINCLKINDINTQASALQQDFQDSTGFPLPGTSAITISATKRANITQMKKDSLMNSFTKAISSQVSSGLAVYPQSRFIIDKENINGKVQSFGGQNANSELAMFGFTQRTFPLKQSNRNTYKDQKINNSQHSLHKQQQQQQQQIFSQHQSICSHLTISKNSSLRDMQQAGKMQLANSNSGINISSSSSSQTPKSAFKQVISKFSQQQMN